MSNMTSSGNFGREAETSVLAKSMATILEMQHRCIYENDGFIPYSSGDLIVAVWSADTSSSPATLAMATARKILTELNWVQTSIGSSFLIQMAVATGEMTGDFVGGRPQIYGAPFTTTKQLLDLDLPARSRLLCTSQTLDVIGERPTSVPFATLTSSSGEVISVFEFTES